MKLAHITIHTNRQEEALQFYRTYAGLDIIRAFGPIIFIGNDSEETLIELIKDDNVQYQGKGLSIGFECKNLEEKRNDLVNAGYQPTDIISPNPFFSFFFVEEPSGVTVQFIASGKA